MPFSSGREYFSMSALVRRYFLTKGPLDGDSILTKGVKVLPALPTIAGNEPQSDLMVHAFINISPIGFAGVLGLVFHGSALAEDVRRPAYSGRCDFLSLAHGHQSHNVVSLRSSILHETGIRVNPLVPKGYSVYRIHRLGHIEANSIEVTMSESAMRRAKQSYSYLTLGFEMEVEKEIGISIEGAVRVTLHENFLTLRPSVLISGPYRR